MRYVILDLVAPRVDALDESRVFDIEKQLPLPVRDARLESVADVGHDALTRP